MGPVRSPWLVVVLLFCVCACAQTNIVSYATLIGGNGDDRVVDLAVDGGGNLYVLGYTNSSDFPATTGAYETRPCSTRRGIECGDDFVMKLDPAGRVMFATLLRGAGGQALAVNASGEIYVAGEATEEFKATAGALNMAGAWLSVAKLNASGTAMSWGARFGSSSWGDKLTDMALDSAGNIYITGWSYRDDYPVTAGAFQTVETGSFVTKFSPDASRMIYSARLGGSDTRDRGVKGTEPQAIAVNSGGEVYVAGLTGSGTFPVTSSAFKQPVANSTSDGFFLKLNSSGSALMYSTVLGGTSTAVRALRIDAAGSAVIAGETGGNIARSASAYQRTYGGFTTDGFLARVNPAKSGTASLEYFTYVGGASNDELRALAIDPAGTAYVAGHSTSNAFPTTSNAASGCRTPSPGYVYGDAVAGVMGGDGSLLRFGTHVASSAEDRSSAVAVDGSGNFYVAGETGPGFNTTTGALRSSGAGREGFLVKYSAAALQSAPNRLLVCAPADGAAVGTGAAVVMSAQGSRRTNSLSVWVDGSKRSEVLEKPIFDSGVSLTAGTHQISGLAEDVLGTTSTAAVMVTSGSPTCNPPAQGIVRCMPSNDGSSASPVRVVAAAGSPAGIAYIQIYVDGTRVYHAAADRLDTGVDMASGVHRLTVQAKDNAGTFYKTTTNVTVLATGETSCPMPETFNTISICAPADRATVSSPVRVKATANLQFGTQYMQVYVDGTSKYHVSGPFLDAQIAMADGVRRVTVQARDNNGSFFRKTVYITVGAASTTCTAPTADRTINVCEPADNATSASPVRVRAMAASSAGVSYTQVYVDGVLKHTASGASVDTAVAMPAGTRRVTVQSKDAAGVIFKKTVYVTVQ